MIKINYKIQFLLFLVCLFFIGMGLYEIATLGLEENKSLFWQLSPFAGFITGTFIFGRNLYTKRVEQFKK
ncbi:hypothetical protein [Flavobacterium agrisoli]|uniref:Uncharacterized protein n=1 Tax=Flavobacterium agrisoli TaxID=2793066 RepID=A0A934UJB2_9FLAO|nr:hypothetical protein [Flavobacterium agrisoli]MBK0369404.1 hypothetical protein [Flavobacterium agrisoli]